MKITADQLVKDRNQLDWYSLTESSNSILNGLIAYTAREEMKELDKAQPDQQRISELVALRTEVRNINRDSSNFQNLERMEQIIAHYGPILRKSQKRSS